MNANLSLSSFEKILSAHKIHTTRFIRYFIIHIHVYLEDVKYFDNEQDSGLHGLGHAEGSCGCDGPNEGGLDGTRDRFITGEAALGIAKNQEGEQS